MKYNEVLKEVTVRVTARDENSGSGIIYKPDGSDLLYIFTAKHCLCGEDFDIEPKRKHIKIDKIKVAEKGSSYKLRKADRIVTDDQSDIAALVVSGEHFPGFSQIPSIELASLDQDGSELWFKGYPSLTRGERQKTGTATLRTMDADEVNFEAEPGGEFLKYYAKNKVPHLSRGFSGSGICGRVGQVPYLQGIVSEFDKSIGFKCVALGNFLKAKLPDLALMDISIELHLSNSTLKENLRKVLDQLKPRYQELNFNVPIQEYFHQFEAAAEYRQEVIERVSEFSDGLEGFFETRFRRTKEIFEKFGSMDYTNSKQESKTFEAAYEELVHLLPAIPPVFIFLQDDFDNTEEWRIARDLVNESFRLLNDFFEALRTKVNEYASSKRVKTQEMNAMREFITSFDDLLTDIADFQQFWVDQRFVGKKYMLVRGKAGNGKSQLLGFAANERMANQSPSILVLGQSLNGEQGIWDQIRTHCCPQIPSEKAFLDILDRKAQLSGKPFIVFIDAINEGRGIRLWNQGFYEFTETLEQYKHIRVVLSFRNSYENALFKNVGYDESAVIEHHGFKGMEKEAVKFFFKEANLPVPVLPYYSEQFGNPLFLNLFTRLYRKRRNRAELHSWVGTLTVYRHFFDHINDQLGAESRYGYDADKLDMVGLSIRKFVKKQLKRRLLYLRYDTAFKLVEKAVGPFIAKKGFLAALISEGLFYENRYIIDQTSDELGVDFAYQKLGEYIKVDFLIRSLSWEDLQSEVGKDKVLHFLADDPEFSESNAGLTEALTIMIPHRFGKEIFELSDDLIENDFVVRAFVSALRDRSSSTITSNTQRYLDQVLSSDRHLDFDLWTELLNLSFQPANALNTEYIHTYLMGQSLAQRDAGWTIFIQDSYQEGYEYSAVAAMIKWALSYKENGITDQNAIKDLGKTIFWFFGSTDLQLRDHATKAAVFLFTENIAALKLAMIDFESVNDPYIAQRIYAVAFGAAVRNNRASAIGDLVQYVHRTIFLQPEVKQDALLRDYARLLVEFGLHLSLDIERPEKARPPYNSPALPAAPTDQDIEGYPERLGYNGENGYGGIHQILSSMVTEHSSRGHMYGDFGRYTFGYAVKHWKRYKDSSLSNLAIQIIVDDLGYNRQLSDLDKRGRYTGRSRPKVERIGKKYQWIAFHRILAQLADHSDYYDGPSHYSKKGKFSGAWEPNIRDIDPTTALWTEREKPDSQWWSKYNYELPEQPIDEWLKDENDLPNLQSLIDVVDDNGDSWVKLEGYQSWKTSGRELWYQMRSYIVRKANKKMIIQWLRKQNLMGRWMPESQSNTELYLREYFWSPALKDFEDSYHGGELWRDLTGRLGGKSRGKVAVAALRYHWERGAENQGQESFSLLLPNQLLYDVLNLKQSEQDGCFQDVAGKIIAFDPSALYDTPSCLLIRKRELIDALEKAGLAIFWTGLGEKLNVGEYNSEEPELFKRMEISDILSLDNTEFVGSTKIVVA
ncbi:hypothetical protein SAMN04487996_117107 [Dyadobacter soli]|uniref:Uncharacterized protein n=1 Tax=Dyadobacter soli TaxID=659014 RepID=A0A1G7T6X1_9BACT|nr:serine protease [Dyadobacter soli]SDG30822.1 hypothetical protein SAMN04487996_117107 [Dyadobacter soli]